MRKPSKRRLVQLLAAAGVVAAFVGFLWATKSSSLPDWPTSLAGVGRLLAGGDPTGREWRVGEERRYAAVLQTTVSAPEDELLNLAVTGTWSLIKLTEASPSAGAVLAGRFEPGEVNLRPPPDDVVALRGALTENLFAELSDRGQVRRIGFDEASDVSAIRNTARGVLRTLFFAVQMAPPPEGREAWESHEADFSGRYVASYRMVSPLSVQKEKKRYLDVLGAGPQGVFTEVESSRAVFHYSGEPLVLVSLKAVDWAESTRVVGDGPFPALSSSLNVKVAYEGASTAQGARLAQLRERLAKTSWLSPSDKSLEEQVALSAAKMSGPGVDELLSTLESSKEGAGGSARHAQAYARLVAHVRFDEAAFEKATKWLEQPGERRDLAIDLLADAGSEAAQRVLHAFGTDNKLSEGERLHVVRALSLLEMPSEATVHYLDKLRAEPVVQRQATYGYGASAYHLREKNPELALAVVQKLIAELKAAHDLHALVTTIRALGNAAHPASLAALQPYLRHENVTVRVAAVDALRRVPGAVADQLLADVLRGNDGSQVRLAALRALGYRPLSAVLVYALREVILGASEKEVLKEALRAGQRWALEAPALLQALQTVAARTDDPEVRRLATVAG